VNSAGSSRSFSLRNSIIIRLTSGVGHCPMTTLSVIRVTISKSQDRRLVLDLMGLRPGWSHLTSARNGRSDVISRLSIIVDWLVFSSIIMIHVVTSFAVLIPKSLLFH
jgi:hypothetical protein